MPDKLKLFLWPLLFISIAAIFILFDKQFLPSNVYSSPWYNGFGGIVLVVSVVSSIYYQFLSAPRKRHFWVFISFLVLLISFFTIRVYGIPESARISFDWSFFIASIIVWFFGLRALKRLKLAEQVNDWVSAIDDYWIILPMFIIWLPFSSILDFYFDNLLIEIALLIVLGIAIALTTILLQKYPSRRNS